ncbi:MAG: hypothetical protein V3U26_06950 [Dehalococcoidia bacterium]|jgi:peroxiredoxin
MSELLKIGEKAPDFALTDTEGSTYALYPNLGEFATVVTFIRGEW